MMLLRRAYSFVQAADVRGRLLHIRKKGQVYSYVNPLKIKQLWGGGEEQLQLKLCLGLVIVAKQLLTTALHKRLVFMPVNLDNCRTASLPFCRFSQ